MKLGDVQNVNPVADLRIMNFFEDMGGSLAGTEYLFRHALLPIPEGKSPLEEKPWPI